MSTARLLPNLCVGNWKAHGDIGLLQDWATAMDGAPGTVVLCVPHPLLTAAIARLQGITEVGAQDIASHGPGNQTGNTTAAMVADSGATWTLVGHSERRAMGETDTDVAAKLVQAREMGLRAILCVGESQQQRQQGLLEQVLTTQLTGALAGQVDLADLVVAYEPVWAIGTGVAAQAIDAQQACSLLRAKLEVMSPGAKIQLLYGGSVKHKNSADFMEQDDVNGLLVGGASLDPVAFAAITKIVAA